MVDSVLHIPITHRYSHKMAFIPKKGRGKKGRLKCLNLLPIWCVVILLLSIWFFLGVIFTPGLGYGRSIRYGHYLNGIVRISKPKNVALPGLSWLLFKDLSDSDLVISPLVRLEVY